jgi:hypothetical protein
LLELAEELARSGKVSDDEMIAAAYIWVRKVYVSTQKV